VKLVVATTTDPASINPANALLAMPGWHTGPFFQVQFQPIFHQALEFPFSLIAHSKFCFLRDCW
jgi:chorismate mutase